MLYLLPAVPPCQWTITPLAPFLLFLLVFRTEVLLVAALIDPRGSPLCFPPGGFTYSECCVHGSRDERKNGCWDGRIFTFERCCLPWEPELEVPRLATNSKKSNSRHHAHQSQCWKEVATWMREKPERYGPFGGAAVFERMMIRNRNHTEGVVEEMSMVEEMCCGHSLSDNCGFVSRYPNLIAVWEDHVGGPADVHQDRSSFQRPKIHWGVPEDGGPWGPLAWRRYAAVNVGYARCCMGSLGRVLEVAEEAEGAEENTAVEKDKRPIWLRYLVDRDLSWWRRFYGARFFGHEETNENEGDDLDLPPAPQGSSTPPVSAGTRHIVEAAEQWYSSILETHRETILRSSFCAVEVNLNALTVMDFLRTDCGDFIGREGMQVGWSFFVREYDPTRSIHRGQLSTHGWILLFRKIVRILKLLFRHTLEEKGYVIYSRTGKFVFSLVLWLRRSHDGYVQPGCLSAPVCSLGSGPHRSKRVVHVHLG